MAAVVESLSALGYLDALVVAARVLEDHAVALDQLGRPDPDPAATPEPGSSPAPVRPGIGSDLAATLSSAVTAADGATDFASISAALERGARNGCSGRAGRGTVTLLTGIGEVLRNTDRLDGTRYALAMEAAAELLAPSDDGRHPGGFAAVVAAVADAALSSSDRGTGLADTIVSSADAGLEELERGPVADARLAATGTVDPAAAGFLLVLDTLASVVTGEPLPERPGGGVPLVVPSTAPSVRFEVACQLTPDRPDPETAVHLEDVLREIADLTRWEVRGDSWNIGLVTTLPGTAVEAIVDVGRPREVHIGVAAPTDLDEASAELLDTSV